jgi:hypothetical protein
MYNILLLLSIVYLIILFKEKKNENNATESFIPVFREYYRPYVRKTKGLFAYLYTDNKEYIIQKLRKYKFL